MQGLRVIVVLVVLVICSTGIALAQGDSTTDVVAPPWEALSLPPANPAGIEIESKRTATSRTFRLPNGSRETRIYGAPINYRDAGGDWAPIEEGFEQAEGTTLRNGESSFDLLLPARMGAAPMKLAIGDHWISQQLIGTDTEAAQLLAKGAEYETSQPGTTFEFTSLGNGIKETIELADASQPSAIRFELKVSPGLSPIQTEEGSIEFTDQGGKAIAVLPAPVMTDNAADNPAVSRDVHYALTSHDDAWELTVEADRNWLSQPDRVWPVLIDPTVSVQSPAVDCSIFGGAYETYSGFCGMFGWQWNKAFAIYNTNETGRSLLKFNLSAIPANAYVTGATVGLHASSAAQNTAGVQLRRVTKSWTQQVSWRTRYCSGACVNWNPPGGEFAADEGAEILTSQRGSQAGWWNFSNGLTPVVQGWVGNPASNNGLLIKLSDEAQKQCGAGLCAQRVVAFDSTATADPAKRPYLSVQFYPPTAAGNKVSSPSEGTATARRLMLEASGSSQTTGVTFQFRQGTSSVFETIPTSLVRDEQGGAISWPAPVQGTQSEPLFFDAAQAAPGLDTKGGPIQIRALFEGTGGAGGYSVPVNATVDPNIGGARDATASVGPGTVNLLTGNFALSRTDVSIPGFGSALEFSRNHNSRDAGTEADTGVLGRGWKPTVPVEAAGGAAWQKLREVVPSQEEKEEGLVDYALLVDLEGYEYAFEKSEETYVSPPGAEGWVLAHPTSSRFTFTDPDGNRTTFEKEPSGSDYVPVSISQTGGSANSTTLLYQLVSGKKRLSAVIAPSATGLDCSESPTKLGCRSLSFSYKAATTWGAPASLGDRLSTITYHGPSTSSSMSSWDVAKYVYDSQGRLAQEWDPRLSAEGAIKESYAYEGGQIRTIMPAGEEPWTLNYEAAPSPELPNARRLLSVQRASLLSSPSIAQTTIAYGVPLNDSGAPYDLSASAVAQWGQQDVPTDATAIFPPDQIPASPPSSYSRASVYYMDAEGQMVNTATPSGAGTSAPSISTAEVDEHGNVVRELSAQNRLRALAAGASSVARSHELETKRLYSPEGTVLSQEWGPLHEVRLESGTVVQAHMHRTFQYDKDAPAPPPGTPWPHLPTRETVGAAIPGQAADADQRVTETKYNWALRKPTDTIVDPSGLNQRTHIEYDPVSGLAIERRLPANPNGGDARTTKFLYYTAGSHPSDSACGNKAAWANLPCKTTPAAQVSGSGRPELLVTRYLAYSPLSQPTEVSESPGGKSEPQRITRTTYDDAGRPLTGEQTGEGVAIPKTETLYSATTGRPTAQRFVCEGECAGFDDQATTTTYDTLGRPSTYEDADGNLSSTSYDLLGRPVTSSDGKGIQTRTYDPTSGLLVKLEDSGAGTFTAAYDADGNLVEQGLPNGLVAETTYNEIGSPVHLSYEKTSCSLECTWLDFDVEESIHGQWLIQTSNLSSQQYAYDKAGRLTQVRDTPQGGGCTTRSYSFDANSNRTKLVTRAPGLGGVCDTSSAGTTQEYSYDTADRLMGTGISYDDFGRITSLPGAYAGGSTLTSSYFVNDLVKSQTQGAITNTYALDAALRQRRRTQTGGSEPGTEIYHYAGGSDSPAWIDRGASWQRNIAAIGGLGAIQDSSKGTTLQLTNLHGDVVATASTSPEATKLLATFEFDEYGNPKQGSTPRYGWLGGKQRRTELPSGIIQMGVRSYVPPLGRFISVDPVLGGSANAYEYGNADPINQVDLDGKRPKVAHCDFHVDNPHIGRHKRHRGRINAILRGSCFAGDVATAKAKVRLSIYRDGRWVAQTRWKTVEIPMHPSPKPMPSAKVAMGGAAPECNPGNYRGVAEIVMWAPPGYTFANGRRVSEGTSISRNTHISRC